MSKTKMKAIYSHNKKKVSVMFKIADSNDILNSELVFILLGYLRFSFSRDISIFQNMCLALL